MVAAFTRWNVSISKKIKYEEHPKLWVAPPTVVVLGVPFAVTAPIIDALNEPKLSHPILSMLT